MPEGAAAIVSQYGAVGLLLVVIIGAGRLGNKMVDRAFQLADKIELALEAYRTLLLDERVSAERRHAETREHITLMSMETRSAVHEEGALCRGESISQRIPIPPRQRKPPQ